jgi:hypothetical protein
VADAQLTLPFPPAGEQPRRRRRAWPWVITLLVVLALLVGAAFLAEWLARGAVENTIRTLVVSQLDLGGQDVDVDVDGIVIPQLISGTLDEVAVSSADVALGPVSGDVAVEITDMPIRADAAAGPGSATVRLDETQLRALLSTVEGFPADGTTIDAPDVTLSTQLSVFGAAVPVGVALLPGVSGVDLSLTPQSFSVGGVELSADGIRSQFGVIADPVLRTWDVCLAQHLPAALSLTSVAAERDQIVATFAIDGAVVIDPALRAKGTCG